MTNPSLHSTQQRLIKLLTNPDAFDLDHPGLIAMGNEIGPDIKHISLCARLSHSKRMSKIEAVLTQTITYLDEPFQPLTRPFLADYPPFSATRYDNARQFFDFLVQRWDGRPVSRPYLLDLARYELAVAYARIQPWIPAAMQPVVKDQPVAVRFSPAVSLIRCNYDIRPLLERDDYAGMPEKRSLFLAIVLPSGSSNERVFEIGADLAGFLAGLTDWQPISKIAGGKKEGLAQLFKLELVEGR